MSVPVSANGDRRPRRPPVARLVLVVSAAAAIAALVTVAVRGPAVPRTLEERVQAVASGLRCAMCHDLSVADSPSSLARDMRAKIARDLRAGRTPADIRAEFEAAYGPTILLSPPRRGFDLVAWLGPVALLAAGCALAASALRRWRRAPAPAPRISEEDRRLLERELAAGEVEP